MPTPASPSSPAPRRRGKAVQPDPADELVAAARKATRDPLERFPYAPRLVDAATDFLVQRFEQGPVDDQSNLVHAAMHIVCGLSWVQPGDAQVTTAYGSST